MLRRSYSLQNYFTKFWRVSAPQRAPPVSNLPAHQHGISGPYGALRRALWVALNIIVLGI